MVRGLVVGAGVLAVTVWFVDLRVAAPLWVLAFALLGAAILGALGLIAGIWADKFDQIAAFQNFLILPLTFLSGVFYSIHSLPPFWQQASHFNPFFYMIDGFRYGFFGASDCPRRSASLAVVAVSFALLAAACLRLLQRGLQAQAIGSEPMVTPESIKHGIAAGLACEHVEVRGRRPAFPGADRLERVRGQEPRAAPPARVRGARRAHARGDPRAVDADADAGGVRSSDG